jgi:hypothetical protein
MNTLFGFAFALLMVTVQSSIQHYGVRGFFKCGDKPYTDAQVLLYDHDTCMLRKQKQREG